MAPKRPSKKRRYKRRRNGEWFRLNRTGHKIACCDCGLVHRFDFRVLLHLRRRGKGMWRLITDRRMVLDMRASRLERATAGMRLSMPLVLVPRKRRRKRKAR